MATNYYGWSSSRTNKEKDEPLFLTKFISTFVLPPVLQRKYKETKIMTESIKKIGGLTPDKIPGLVTQNYRSTSRRFIGTVVDDTLNVSTDFEVNVDAQGKIYPLNIIRDWIKVCYDVRNGMQMPKRDYAGQQVIEVHDKLGKVLIKHVAKIVFPFSALPALDLEYFNEAIYAMSVDWVHEDYLTTMLSDSIF